MSQNLYDHRKKITDGIFEDVRLVLGSVSSCPLKAVEAEQFLTGKPAEDSVIEEAATLAARIAKPLDNTDFNMTWRKKVTHEFVISALRELRGDVIPRAPYL